MWKDLHAILLLGLLTPYTVGLRAPWLLGSTIYLDDEQTSSHKGQVAPSAFPSAWVIYLRQNCQAADYVELLVGTRFAFSSDWTIRQN